QPRTRTPAAPTAHTARGPSSRSRRRTGEIAAPHAGPSSSRPGGAAALPHAPIRRRPNPQGGPRGRTSLPPCPKGVQEQLPAAQQLPYDKAVLPEAQRELATPERIKRPR